jgi:hypothetical protein
MPNSVVDVTDLNVERSGTQENGSVTGSQASFRGIKIIPSNAFVNVNPAIKENINYDAAVYSTSDSAQGTAEFATPNAGDTVTVNALVYTGVSGAKSNNTQYTIDGGNTAIATDLADSVNNDTRSGTIGDLQATSTGAVVTFTSTLNGAAGNAVTLAESTAGARITISGATFTGGTDGPVTVNIAARQVTVPNDVGGIAVQSASFLTGLISNTTTTVQAIPIENKNGSIDYQIFWSAVGTGAVAVDLTVITLRTPSNNPPATFPLLPLNSDPIAFDVVLREDNGIEKVYDCFYLSSQ